MGWAIELRKPKIRVPTPWLWREGNIGDSAIRELKAGPGVVREPSTSRNNRHENRETSTASRRDAGTVREGDLPQAGHVRRGGVGLRCSTYEAAEQRGVRASAEAVEGRAWTKENAVELYTSPTQSGEIRVPGVTRRARSETRFDAMYPR
jgi:hypothetical protein